MRAALFSTLLAAALGLGGPSLAQEGRDRTASRPAPAVAVRPPLQPEPGDIWAEVRGWHEATRPRPGARPPAPRGAAMAESPEAGEPAAAHRQPRPAAQPRRRSAPVAPAP
ncbi:hypothetical protein JYK14_00570 [Siccirubricoccus sp. KC 17139]|uniref:Uncharacterized protein n=1 Tax=Siccirubricoccus soli TaxID=2899147 RepID=A0ABT1CYD3_9PROT|nr:hypothetical protein [Siccirubricoccus soli]MCO6414673.1 hypothetical protein [Siccirubricoccus soli]MCP2680803.1 hypothetical protein [Siccirubricoccus soli]